MKSLYDKANGSYIDVDDVEVPTLVSVDTNYEIGFWGQRHKEYLKENHRVIYYNLLTSGKLNSYLHDIDIRAKQLSAAEIMTPCEYWASIGRNCGKPPEKPFNRYSDTVAFILSKQEYIGDTINFRATRKSFKNKKKLDNPKDKWKMFKNTYPAIISEENFNLVRELRKNKRRSSFRSYIAI